MPLSPVKIGDRHTAAHNEERAFANDLESTVSSLKTSMVPVFSESFASGGGDANNYVVPGKFFVESATLNTPGSMDGHLEVLDRSASGRLVQRFTSASGATAGEQWNRYRNPSTGAWQPWKKLFVESDLGDKIIHGTGDPRGVVSSPRAGTIYVDRAATNGARSWYATGTGTGAWTPSDADTGYRDISSLLDSSWVTSPAYPRFHIRRRGDLVSLDCRFMPASATVGKSRTETLGVIQTLPAGFVPSAYTIDTFITYTSTNPASTHRVQNLSSPSYIRLSNGGASGTWVSSDRLIFSLMWSTAQGWPNSLPGVPD